MTWCHLPGAACPSAQAAADLTWVLSLPSRALPPPVTSSGKSIREPLLHRHSEPVISRPRRSGTTSKPSTLDPGAVSSIPFSRVIHASPFLRPAPGLASEIPAISGPTSPASSANASRDGSSLRMWMDTSALAQTPCCESYGTWVGRLRLAYSRRKKFARRTKGKDGSAWPTARVQMANGAGGGQQGGNDLQTTATTWPTPMAGTPAQNGNSAAGNSDFSRKAEELAKQLRMTPTPTQTREGQSGEEIQAARERVAATVKNGNGFGLNLGAQVGLWTTPQAHDVTQRGSGQMPTSRAGNACLTRDATSFSRLDHPSKPLGLKSCMTTRSWRPLFRLMKSSASAIGYRAILAGRSTRRLNPIFVEWLMSWPAGHALCDCSATEYARFQRRMRGALSALPTASGPWIWEPPAKTAPEPTQMDMFGGLGE